MTFIEKCKAFYNEWYSYFFSLNFDDLKTSLKDSSVSNRLLFNIALHWHTTPGWIKSLIWVGIVLAPIFLFGATLATPVIVAFGLMAAGLIAAEAQLIDKEIKGLECHKKHQKILKEEKAVIDDINVSMEAHKEQELNHDIPDLEQGQKLFLESGEQSVVASKRTKTQQVVLNNNFVAKKTADTRVKIREAINDANQFIATSKKYKQALRVDSAKWQKEFVWTLHVRSIGDLQTFCKNNIVKLLLLFQQIESKGMTVVCHIKQGDFDSNTQVQKLALEDSGNAPLLLTDALETVDESDGSLSVSDVVAPEESIIGSSWKMSFSLLGLPRPHATFNPDVQKQSLVVKSINDEQGVSSRWSLTLMDDDNKANALAPVNELELAKSEPLKKSEGSLTVVVTGNNQSADLIKSMQALTGQKNTASFFEQDLTVENVLVSDVGYQKTLKTLELCEERAEKREQMKQQWDDVDDLLASLQC